VFSGSISSFTVVNFNTDFFHCSFKAPSSGPKTVSANETSSTTIVVRWNEVDLLHRNGIIEGYKVYYGALNVPFRYKKVPSNATFTTTLTELRKFTQYSIQVLAYTRIGDGILSVPPIVVQTMEDGNNYLIEY
jgi:protein sidekick